MPPAIRLMRAGLVECPARIGGRCAGYRHWILLKPRRRVFCHPVSPGAAIVHGVRRGLAGSARYFFPPCAMLLHGEAVCRGTACCPLWIPARSSGHDVAREMSEWRLPQADLLPIVPRWLRMVCSAVTGCMRVSCAEMILRDWSVPLWRKALSLHSGYAWSWPQNTVFCTTGLRWTKTADRMIGSCRRVRSGTAKQRAP
jgi:hypothetical protein